MLSNKAVEELKQAAISNMTGNCSGSATATINGKEYRADSYSKMSYRGKISYQVTFFVIDGEKATRIKNAELEAATK